VLAVTLPLTADYRLVQTEAERLCLTADCDAAILPHCRDALNELFTLQGIDTSRLVWVLQSRSVSPNFDAKRRRIVREWGKE
jgi:hypothetical protein